MPSAGRGKLFSTCAGFNYNTIKCKLNVTVQIEFQTEGSYSESVFWSGYFPLPIVHNVLSF